MAEATEMRQKLVLVLGKVRKAINRARDKKGQISEAQTKVSLINPILEGLGWDTADMDEVSLEYKHKPQDNPVDYALFLQRSPCLFVEAKSLDTNLDDHKWRSQAVNYANAAGVRWCVLTDGDKYCIYNSHAPVAVAQKLFRMSTISDPTQDESTLDTLGLLSKEALSGNLIDELWEAHFVDRSVRAALEALFGTQDARLVSWVKKQTPALKPAQIRESLKRADIRIDFPVLPPPIITKQGVDDRLEGKPRAQAVFSVLMQRTRETIGDFSVHANSRHIVFSNRHAFVAISALHRGLRIGLRLNASEAHQHPRLKAQAKGIFEGWTALHLSTSISDESEIDQELLSLMKSAYTAAS